jgi:hypothetical protein
VPWRISDISLSARKFRSRASFPVILVCRQLYPGELVVDIRADVALIICQ